MDLSSTTVRANLLVILATRKESNDRRKYQNTIVYDTTAIPSQNRKSRKVPQVTVLLDAQVWDETRIGSEHNGLKTQLHRLITEVDS